MNGSAETGKFSRSCGRLVTPGRARKARGVSAGYFVGPVSPKENLGFARQQSARRLDAVSVSEVDVTDSQAPYEGTTLESPPEVAKRAAIDRLSSALEERGFSAQAANLIATAVTDPSDARRRLQVPSIMRLPEATIEYVNVN